MMAWVRWNDATQTRLQPPVTIGNEVHPGVWNLNPNPNPNPNPHPNPNLNPNQVDPGFWKPFNSLAEYLIAGRGLSVSKAFS